MISAFRCTKPGQIGRVHRPFAAVVIEQGFHLDCAGRGIDAVDQQQWPAAGPDIRIVGNMRPLPSNNRFSISGEGGREIAAELSVFQL